MPGSFCQHTTTIIQLIIFVSIGLTSFCSLTADGDKDNELDDSGCVLTVVSISKPNVKL